MSIFSSSSSSMADASKSGGAELSISKSSKSGSTPLIDLVPVVFTSIDMCEDALSDIISFGSQESCRIGGGMSRFGGDKACFPLVVPFRDDPLDEVAEELFTNAFTSEGFLGETGLDLLAVFSIGVVSSGLTGEDFGKDSTLEIFAEGLEVTRGEVDVVGGVLVALRSGDSLPRLAGIFVVSGLVGDGLFPRDMITGTTFSFGFSTLTGSFIGETGLGIFEGDGGLFTACPPAISGPKISAIFFPALISKILIHSRTADYINIIKSRISRISC
jgi:hypothetical protein